MTAESSRPFGARRALLLFLTYVVVQFGTGIVAGIVVAIWYGVRRGLSTPGVVTGLGLATLWMRIATGSLVPPILLHTGYNGVLAVAVVGALA